MTEDIGDETQGSDHNAPPDAGQTEEPHPQLRVRLTALLVEDSPSDAALVTALAAESGREIDVHTVHSAAAALQALDADPQGYDVVLLDLGLPDSVGLEGVVKLVTSHPGVPVAVLTGDDDDTLATGAVARGAQEFMAKSELTPERLDRMISQALIRHEHRRALVRTEEALSAARSEQRRAEQRLTHQRHHDPLTGLRNRTALIERLRPEAERASPAHPLWLILFDIHRFGLISTSAGPQMGDRVLVALASRLQRHLGEGEMVARIDGDELALLCAPGRGSVRARAEALRTEIGRPLQVGDTTFELDVSIGISTAESPTSGAQLFSEAHASLGRARIIGAGTVMFTAHMRDEAAQLLSTESWIRNALREGGLRLQFQPIVSLPHAELMGVEALLRLRSPTGEDVPPAQFIPIAEQSGLILPMGAWVIEEVGHWVREWRAHDPAGRLQVSVNVSPRQLGDRRLLELAAGVVPDSELRGGLTVELTETSLLEASSEAVASLTELRKLGHRLAIDDFGTGYGSLTYLWRYQVDVLKIDKSFVQAMADDRSAHEIVSNVVQLGHSMQLTTVAEGVETEEQRQLLVDLGCEEAQGYLFAHPLNPPDITGLLLQPQPLG